MISCARTYISEGNRINKFTDPAATLSAVKITTSRHLRVWDSLTRIISDLFRTRFLATHCYIYVYGVGCATLHGHSILFPGHRCFRDQLLYSRTFLSFTCARSQTRSLGQEKFQDKIFSDNRPSLTRGEHSIIDHYIRWAVAK